MSSSPPCPSSRILRLCLISVTKFFLRFNNLIFPDFSVISNLVSSIKDKLQGLLRSFITFFNVKLDA